MKLPSRRLASFYVSTFPRFYFNGVDEGLDIGVLFVLRFEREAPRVQRSMVVFFLNRPPLLRLTVSPFPHRLEHVPLLHPPLLLLA